MTSFNNHAEVGFELLEASPAPAFLVGADHRVRFANRAFLDEHGKGRSAEAVRGMSPGQALDCQRAADARACGEEPACSDCGVMSALLSSLSGRPVRRAALTLSLRGEHGVPRPLAVRVSAAPLSDGSGTLVTVEAADPAPALRDEALAALAESERRYRLLAENAQDVIWTMDLATARFTYVSPSILRLRGLTVEEALEEPLAASLTPASLARVQAIQALRGQPGGVGPPHGASSLIEVFDQICKDGSIKHVEITLSLISDEQGAAREVLGVSRDVTARVEAEGRERAGRATLDDSLATLCGVVNSVDAAIFSVDRAYRYTSFNATHAAMMRALYDRDVQLGDSLAACMTVPEDWAKARANIDRALAGERVGEEALSGEAGRSRYVFEVSHHPVRSADGGVIGAAVFARDVSEQRRAQASLAEAEAQLRQAQKLEAVGQLAGGVAHDFNNLLAVILCSVAFVQEAVSDPALGEDLEAIRLAGERAQALTRHLLAFSRKQVLAPRVLALDEVLRDMEKILRRIVPEHVDLQTKLQPGLACVEADSGQIEQVVLNLVLNARDAMPRGGTLTIETADARVDQELARHHLGLSPGDYVALSIRDTGCGMAPATLARIFEPFFTTKPLGQGTGLGLSTVYGIVKQSGGEVWAESELGVGSVFRVYLPRSSAAPSVHAQSPQERTRARPGESILVVEDDPHVRAVAVRTLELLGYQVLAADSLGSATEQLAARGRPVDLLLTDVVMPVSSGPEVASALGRRQPGLRTLYMSGYTDATVISRLPMPADAVFLQKPFTRETLAAKVREAIERPPRAPG